MSEPTSSTAAGGYLLYKAALAFGIPAGLAAIVVMLWIQPKSKREWTMALICTVVSSVGGGEFSVVPTATATSSVLGISLPIASAFTAARQAGGSAIHNSATISQDGYGLIFADATNDRASVRFTPNNAANHPWRFTFTYLVV